MKKAKIWIRTCVCILLYTTFVACSRGTGSQRIDDDYRISLLKQNIPKDYKIPVHFIPKDMSGVCWVELNTFHLEGSLKFLADMFGNVSANRNDITIFIQMLRDVRYRIGADMEATMQDFECHYKREEWQAEDFFDFVREFLRAASLKTESAECDSPPCPTTEVAQPATDDAERQYLPEDAQKGLLSLFVLSVAANIFLLIWMQVRARRWGPGEGTEGSGDVYIAVEEDRPASDHGASEKNRLNTENAI